MARYNHNASPKTLNATTAETISWESKDISADTRKVKQLMIELTGTDNDVNSIVETRVKAEGKTIFAANEQELRALWQALYASNLGPAAADPSYSINLGGFPHGKGMTVEVQKDNTGAAGTAFLGWEEQEQDTSAYLQYIGRPANCLASTARSRFNFESPGLVIGFFLRAAGVDRAALYIKGVGEIVNLRRVLLRQAQLDGNVRTEINYWFFKLTTPMAAPEGSYLEFDTNATWSGAAERVAIAAAVPVGVI